MVKRVYLLWKKVKKISAIDIYKSILTWKNMDVSFCDKLFDISLFSEKKFPLGKYNEDVFLMFELLNEIEVVYHVGKPLYYYLQRENSISSSNFSPSKMHLMEA